MASRLLLFALAFALFFIGPPMLSFPLPGYPLMKAGDAFDLLTPLVLIPLYWRVWQGAMDRPASKGQTTLFLALGALWVLGQGMHLAANSIGHHLEELAGSSAYLLTVFYDEVLSHYLWHAGILGLTALIVFTAARGDAAGREWPGRIPLLASLVYGLTYFVIVIEAQTWPIGIPFALLVSIWLLRWRLRRRAMPATLWFFGLAHLLALILFVGWWLRWGGLPEFSELGWI